MNKPVVIASLLIVAASALQLVDRHRRNAEMDRLRGDLASLAKAQEAAQRRAAAEVAALRRSMVGAAPVIATPASAAPAPAATPAEPAARQAAPRRLEVGELRGRYEDRFAHERPDPDWSRNAEAEVQATLASKLPATSELRSVQCRASLCRVETVHASNEAYNQFFEASFMSANPNKQPWNGGVFSAPLGDQLDGRVAFVSYLKREVETPMTASALP
jgi:hypothetical protein